MRRVIAEDPEWNLETVPPLVDACIAHITRHFAEQPLLEELLPKHRQKVLEKLPASVPIEVTALLISEEGYWERCCRGRWPLCDVTDFGHSWKRMYFERNAEEAIETFVPEKSDIKKLAAMLKLSSGFVRRLIIKQLLPPPQDKLLTVTEDDDGMSEDTPLKPCNDHLDTTVILQSMPRLEELQLCYGVQSCGMNFEWSLFEFTKADCHALSKAVKATPTLRVLRLHRSKVADDRGRQLVSHLLDHPSLSTLDLSYNKLADGSGRGLGKLLNGHAPRLACLEVGHNLLAGGSGSSIGHALALNCTLTHLNLRMNRLGDEGVQPILKALLKNSTLISLNIGSNNFGEPSAPALAEMLIGNTTITTLSITCNKLGEAGGKLLQEGMEENHSLLTFDLRLTDISQESEYSINQVVKGNQDRAKHSHAVST